MSTSRFRMVSYEDANEEVKYIYDDAMRTMGLPFVLNWFKCQGGSPTILKGNWEKLKTTLLMGVLPNVLKQLIIYNISRERNCEYCAFVHGLLANQMSTYLTGGEQVNLTDNMDSGTIPSSYKSAIRIATKGALDHNKISDEDFEALKDEGFTEAEIEEIFAQSDLANMLNTIADVSGIKVDNELTEAKS